MKKIKTSLKLMKTTVRVLQAAELTAVQGGGGAGHLTERASSNNPTACAPNANFVSSNNPTACAADA